MGGDAQCHQPASLSWSGTEFNKSMTDQSKSLTEIEKVVGYSTDFVVCINQIV
jgi:hypothetical protein